MESWVSGWGPKRVQTCARQPRLRCRVAALNPAAMMACERPPTPTPQTATIACVWGGGDKRRQHNLQLALRLARCHTHPSCERTHARTHAPSLARTHVRSTHAAALAWCMPVQPTISEDVELGSTLGGARLRTLASKLLRRRSKLPGGEDTGQSR